MSLDVGVTRRRGELASRFQGVLDQAAEVRGADRILAETFWRTAPPGTSRGPMPHAARVAPVLSLPLRRT